MFGMGTGVTLPTKSPENFQELLVFGLLYLDLCSFAQLDSSSDGISKVLDQSPKTRGLRESNSDARANFKSEILRSQIASAKHVA